MAKYKVLSENFFAGAVGEIVELPKDEGDAWVGYGRLESVVSKTRKPRKTTKAANKDS